MSDVARSVPLPRPEQRDELAAFHCPVSRASEAHLNYGSRLLRCGISVRPMTALGQKRPSRCCTMTDDYLKAAGKKIRRLSIHWKMR
jgi:hypothetical protein